MKALFAHDHNFIVERDSAQTEVYSPGKLPYAIWERYLQFFETLTVVGRKKLIHSVEDKRNELSLSSGPGVSFEFIPDLANPKSFFTSRNHANSILKDLISNVDAVIARLPSEAGLKAVHIADELNKPWAIEVVGCPLDSLWYYGNWQGKLYAPIMMLRTKAVVRKSLYTVYVTRDFLQRRYPSKGYSAGISNVRIPFNEDIVLSRRIEKIQSANKIFVLGIIGSLKNKYKGIHTAIEALGNVSTKLQPFELRILGSGDIDHLKAFAESKGLKGNIKFCGIIPSGKPVFKWFDEVDLFLQPSFAEGLPRTLIEAMSRACPSLGSTAGGIPELLSPDTLHRPGDEKHLGELIVHACRDVNWQLAQAKRNFKISRNYSEDILEEKRITFWNTFSAHVSKYVNPRH